MDQPVPVEGAVLQVIAPMEDNKPDLSNTTAQEPQTVHPAPESETCGAHVKIEPLQEFDDVCSKHHNGDKINAHIPKEHVNIEPLQEFGACNEHLSSPVEGDMTSHVPMEVDANQHHDVPYEVPFEHAEGNGMHQCCVHGPIVIQPQESSDQGVLPQWANDDTQQDCHDVNHNSHPEMLVHQGVPIKIEPKDDTETVSCGLHTDGSLCADANCSTSAPSQLTEHPPICKENIKAEPIDDHHVCRLNENVQNFSNIKTEKVKFETAAHFCILCEKYFESRARLEDYVAKNPKQFHCDECLEGFVLKGVALHHAYTKHKGGGIFKKGKGLARVCPICSLPSMNELKADLHIRNHDRLIFTCPEKKCGWMFEKNSEMKAHIRSIHQSDNQSEDSDEISHLCANCLPKMQVFPEEVFDFCERNVQEPVQKPKPGSENSCPMCSRRFPTMLALSFHMVRNELNTHRCAQCASSFDNKNSLDKHVTDKHRQKRPGIKGAVEILCSKCPKSFPTVDALNAHMKSHSIITCLSCNKSFRTEERLQRHKSYCDKDLILKSEVKSGNVLVKTMALPPKSSNALQSSKFPCASCPRMLLSQQLLDSHLAEHKVGRYWYMCHFPECKWMYKTFTELCEHVAKAHKTSVKCMKCHVQVWSEKLYNDHMGKCTGFYKCEKCLDIFNKQSSLNDHTCSGRVENPCPICPRILETQEILNSHLVEHRNKRNWYACHYKSCAWMTKEYDELCGHVSETHGDLPKCMRCGFPVYSKEEYNDHLKKCSGFVICEKCNTCTEVSDDLGDNLCAPCRRKKNDAQCVSCRKQFQCKSSPDDYILEIDGNMFQCCECVAQFTDKNVALCHAYFQHTGCTVVGFGKAARRFKCCMCTRLFVKKDHLEKHMKMHSELYVKCGKYGCDQMFETPATKAAHMQMDYVHKRGHYVAKEQVLCPKCLPEYTEEIPQASFNKKFKCWNCDERFQRKGERMTHYNIEHSGLARIDGDTYTCKLCLRKYTEKHQFEHHITYHAKFEWECPECMWAFQTEKEIVAHAKEEHDSANETTLMEILRFNCKRCKIHLPHEDALQFHLMKEHDQSDLQCTICGRNFVLAKSLEAHMADHDVMTHKCWVCGSGYDNNLSLDMHKQYCPGKLKKCKPLMQGKEWNFLCIKCKVSFKSEDKLAAHWTTVHGEVYFKRGPKVKCAICNNRYEDSSMLINHILDKHPVDRKLPASDTAKKSVPLLKKMAQGHTYACSECQTEFPDAGKLHVHINGSSCETLRKPAAKSAQNAPGQKPTAYMCQVCSKIFGDLQLLCTHLKIHEYATAANSTSAKSKRLDLVLFPPTEVTCAQEQSLLGRPKASVQPRTKERFVCMVCEAEFFDHYLFQKHMASHPDWRQLATGVTPVVTNKQTVFIRRVGLSSIQMGEQQNSATTLASSQPIATGTSTSTQCPQTVKLRTQASTNPQSSQVASIGAPQKSLLDTTKNTPKPIGQITVLKIPSKAEVAQGKTQWTISSSSKTAQVVQNGSLKIEPLHQAGSNLKQLQVIDLSSKGTLLQKTSSGFSLNPTAVGQIQLNPKSTIRVQPFKQAQEVPSINSSKLFQSMGQIDKAQDIKVEPEQGEFRLEDTGNSQEASSFNIVQVTSQTQLQTTDPPGPTELRTLKTLKYGAKIIESPKANVLNQGQPRTFKLTGTFGSLDSKINSELRTQNVATLPDNAPLCKMPSSGTLPDRSQWKWKCSKCDKVFRKETDLKSHIICQHAKGNAPKLSEREYSVCGEVYQESHLKSHVICQHTNVRVQSKKGDAPKLSENSAPKLSEHQCSVCSKDFQTDSLLKSHIISQHANNFAATLSEHKCSVCDEVFQKESHLKSHIICAHEWIGDPDRKKSNAMAMGHKCPFCPRVFYIRMALTSHILDVHKHMYAARKRQATVVARPGWKRKRKNIQGPRVVMQRLSESLVKRYLEGSVIKVAAKRHRTESATDCVPDKKRREEAGSPVKSGAIENKTCENSNAKNWPQMLKILESTEDKDAMKKLWINWADTSKENDVKRESKKEAEISAETVSPSEVNYDSVESGETHKRDSKNESEICTDLASHFMEPDEPLDLDLPKLPLSVLDTFGEDTVPEGNPDLLFNPTIPDGTEKTTPIGTAEVFPEKQFGASDMQFVDPLVGQDEYIDMNLLDNLPTADTPSTSDVQPKISEFNKTAEHFESALSPTSYVDITVLPTGANGSSEKPENNGNDDLVALSQIRKLVGGASPPPLPKPPQLKVNQVRVKSRTMLYKCGVCQGRFVEYQKFASHMKTHKFN